jgi:GTP-binding protein EngB required for normal cell division
MPLPSGLNESHQRRLLANAQYADKLLSDIEGILNANESKSAFPKYRPDVSLHQSRQLRSQIGRFRDHLSRVLDAVGVRRKTAQFASLHSIGVNLAFVRIAVQEMAPEYLRGYGELPGEISSEIRGLCTELEGLINRMERSLAPGEAIDLAARLDRLDQTCGEAELIRLLDRITSDHELAEFRSPLTGLVERLESPRFEIAVFGRVSSGKSSLLNRLLDTRVLPVGVNPITAVPTRIVFGREPSFTASFVDRRTLRLPIEDLIRYASEEWNLGNELGVIKLTVTLPSPRLGNGLVLVDTPGLGALAKSGAAETLSYLPQCDLGIVLVSAASPLDEEDLNTMQALTRAAIPVMLLLSKADLLSVEDCHKAAEYARRETLNHLGLKIGVRPVSTLPQHEALLDGWFQEELAPLFDRQKELALQSLRRKAGALREAVIVALQAKLGVGEARASHAKLEEAERSLRNAAASIEEARRACIAQTDEMRSLNEAVVKSAASSLSGQRIGPGSDLAASLIRSAAESAAVRAPEDLARLLGDVAESLQEALSLAEQTLHSNEAPLGNELKRIICELPRFELALPEISLRPPWYLPFSRLVRAWLAKRIERSAGQHLEAAFIGFSRALAAWAHNILAELQSRFDERADVYRAQLGRLISSNGSRPEEQARVEHDLAELEHWTGAYSRDSSMSERTC